MLCVYLTRTQGASGDGGESCSALVMAEDGSSMPATATGGYELLVPGTDGGVDKVLGSREFARFYRQKHRPEDMRQAVVVNTMLAKCVGGDGGGGQVVVVNTMLAKYFGGDGGGTGAGRGWWLCGFGARGQGRSLGFRAQRSLLF